MNIKSPIKKTAVILALVVPAQVAQSQAGSSLADYGVEGSKYQLAVVQYLEWTLDGHASHAQTDLAASARVTSAIMTMFAGGGGAGLDVVRKRSLQPRDVQTE